VLLTLSRAESLAFHPKRHPLTMTYTVGCDAEGRLTGVRARIVGDTGAYASVGDKVLERAAGHACGPYRFEAVDVESTAVYTNNPPNGAMRGFGVNQVAFAIDGMLDRLAERVGIDPWEIRWRNALEVGDTFGTGQVLGPGVGIKACLEAVRDAYRGARYAGIGCGVKNTGIGNGLKEMGRAILRPEADGTITLFHSWTEMGQGVNTVLAQIVCEELGIAFERVRVIVDTMRDLDTGQTTASRSTVLGGRAVQEAVTKLKGELNGSRLEDLAGREFYGEIVAEGTHKPGTPGIEHPVTHFAYAWAVQVVLLNEEGRVERVIAAHDVGKALNPTLVEGQVEGGVHMGLGFGLTEEFTVEGGVPTTTTLKSLGIIPAPRMPEVETIIVEVPQPQGPYGAKGAGEIGLVPTAAACAGALRAFDGRWRTRLPMRDSAAALALVPKLAGSARRAETE
jgi:xanthine dehydrogenase molybdenum-binding subunit